MDSINKQTHRYLPHNFSMMASRYWNVFRITGPLWGESTSRLCGTVVWSLTKSMKVCEDYSIIQRKEIPRSFQWFSTRLQWHSSTHNIIYIHIYTYIYIRRYFYAVEWWCAVVNLGFVQSVLKAIKLVASTVSWWKWCCGGGRVGNVNLYRLAVYYLIFRWNKLQYDTDKTNSLLGDIMFSCSQCWKFPQVRQSEADNFGGGPETFC